MLKSPMLIGLSFAPYHLTDLYILMLFEIRGMNIRSSVSLIKLFEVLLLSCSPLFFQLIDFLLPFYPTVNLEVLYFSSVIKFIPPEIL